MEFMAHFKYDRDITLWLCEFMHRALPGACVPNAIEYDVRPSVREADFPALDIFMTLDVPDGQVDVAVTMAAPGARALAATGPRFEFAEITRDVQDASGAHLRTLVWDDIAGRWLEVHDPLDGLSVLGGGLA